MNSGIVEAWTGVMRFNPRLVTASIIHPARGGVRISQAREEVGVEVPTSRLGIDEVMAKLIVESQRLSPRRLWLTPIIYLSLSTRDLNFCSVFF